MFVLGFLLGVLLAAAVVTFAYWWWLAPLPSETSLAARQAIHDIERRTVHALLREEWMASAAGDVVEGQAVGEDRS